MNNNDIKVALDALSILTCEVESQYIENEGEVTQDITRLEEEIASLQILLTGEGVDSLGRWLKAKEDEKKSLKAEKDYITRRINATDNTIEFIKAQIHNIMVCTGMDKIKGSNGYSFSPTISETTSVDKDVLKANYADDVEKAIRVAGIPDYINVTLTASSTIAKEIGLSYGDGELFKVTEKPSVRFTKPRANKSEE